MADGSLSPLDYPSDTVTIRCDACGREGRYRREMLIARYGVEAPLPSILNEITACSRNDRLSTERCRAYYVELRARFDSEIAQGHRPRSGSAL